MINEVGLHEHPVGSCISFKAILAGAFVAIGLGFLLNLFGTAIGLSAFTMGPNGSLVTVVGGFIGLVVGVFVTQLAAGFVAGYLGATAHHRRHLGIIYGFTTWSVALVLSAFIIGNVSQYTTAYTHMVGPVAEGGQSKAEASNAKAMKAKSGEATQEIATADAASLARAAFSVFALFFIGALSACMGACIAIPCRKDEYCTHSAAKHK